MVNGKKGNEHRFTSEEKKVLAFGCGPVVAYNKNATVNETINIQFKKYSNQIAVRYNSVMLTYHDLELKVNKLANFLLAKKVKPHSKIAIFLEPSIDLIISILAILKIGGCYVPLDLHYPIERLNFMLKDSGSAILLTNSAVSQRLMLKDIQVVELDKHRAEIKKEKNEVAKIAVSSDDPVYIIYTSGSTGVPKGIVIHHQALNNHMLWMQRRFKFKSTDSILLKTSLSFDPSIWEIFLPFYIGGQLIIAPFKAALDAKSLVKFIIKFGITTIQFVPSLLNEFLKQKNIARCKSLKYVFCGGESLQEETKKNFFKKMACSLYNLYGPAEATIEITSHKFRKKENFRFNIIGKPIDNVTLYVLNDKKKLAKIEEVGELYIGGDCLSKGYINQQENFGKFVDNPFENKSTKLYKTGDHVRWLRDGNLEYVGRDNDQVKINGVRIELQELKEQILQNKSVESCVLIKKNDNNGYSYLACYLVPQDVNDFNLVKLKENLKKFIPHYMLPRTYTVIKSIPLTVNGKIDTDALSDSNDLINVKRSSLGKPKSKEEKKLLKIWSNILAHDDINIYDNFFESGGHSLLAIQLLQKIEKEFRIVINIKDLFTYSTIYDQAKYLKKIKIKKQQKENKQTSKFMKNALISFRKDGSKCPLFLIHPIGGTVFWYFMLSQLIDNARPVFGIQDPAIELDEKIFTSIGEMAAAYIALIKRQQPTGPYLIGGASFGATVAVEIANQIHEKWGEKVIIPVLDGWAVYPGTLGSENYFKESMRRQHNEISKKFKEFSLSDPDHLLDVQKHRLSLLLNYQLKDVRGEIGLFKAQAIMPIFKEVDAVHNHWDNYTNKEVKTYIVPGDHETMFQVPNVSVLAQFLNQFIDDMDIDD